MKHLILIADEYRARLFTFANAAESLREIKGLIHPKGRLADQALVTDRPGRVRSGRRPAVAAMSPHTDPKAVEAEHFAAELARALRTAAERSECDALAIVAPPKFLGLIRQRLDDQTRKRVIACVHKDLTLAAPNQLRPYLPAVFDAAASPELGARADGAT